MAKQHAQERPFEIFAGLDPSRELLCAAVREEGGQEVPVVVSMATFRRWAGYAKTCQRMLKAAGESMHASPLHGPAAEQQIASKACAPPCEPD